MSIVWWRFYYSEMDGDHFQQIYSENTQQVFTLGSIPKMLEIAIKHGELV